MANLYQQKIPLKTSAPYQVSSCSCKLSYFYYNFISILKSSTFVKWNMLRNRVERQLHRKCRSRSPSLPFIFSQKTMMSQITKDLSIEWNGLPEKEKKKYTIDRKIQNHLRKNNLFADAKVLRYVVENGKLPEEMNRHKDGKLPELDYVDL